MSSRGSASIVSDLLGGLRSLAAVVAIAKDYPHVHNPKIYQANDVSITICGAKGTGALQNSASNGTVLSNEKLNCYLAVTGLTHFIAEV